MASEDQWTHDHYDELVKEYGGMWVLIKDNKVIFSDRHFDVVYKRSLELCTSPDDCVIRRIDSGDAVFYGITIPDKKD